MGISKDWISYMKKFKTWQSKDLKSCNENPVQDDAFEATIDKENLYKGDKIYHMSQDEESDQDKIDTR